MSQERKVERIGCLWYDRPATLREATEQLLAFLLQLKAYKPEFFGIWYERAYSRKKALEHRVEFTYAGIRRLFKERTKNDEIYPELTFMGGGWNGADGLESGGFSAAIGGSKESTTGANTFYIDLPYFGPQHDYYQDPAHQEELIQLLRDYWKPEFVRIRYRGVDDFVDIPCQ